jgi:hypothetical protein
VTLSNRPLRREHRDKELFVGRESEVESLVTAVGAELNCFVLGARGIGKTSFLARCSSRLEQEYFVVPVNASTATSVHDLVGLLRLPLGLRDMPVGRVGTAGSVTAVEAVSDFVRQIDAFYEHRPESRRIVFLIDDLRAPDVVTTVFGDLKDYVWRTDVTWVRAAAFELRAVVERPPVNAFFERVIELEPLGRDTALDLVARRIPDLPRATAASIVDAANGSPRELVGWARMAAVGASPDSRNASSTPSIEDKMRAESERQQQIAGQLGRSATMLAAELAHLGPVSASDNRLLDRLGWSRARAAKALAELEEHGFAESWDERMPVGRPRRVYRLKDVG